ncbi:hemerythrin domain-containing protein [Nocardia huaxiensis]|uniref:Hemerythrin domain-containing protein n=1 Tax=Nocardia huaxiensis TaxID=2755382 RepID=A0A7D6V750_9NOCA|nr:hemerythrin domain-containing protein [Nocardia huaxiensis]
MPDTTNPGQFGNRADTVAQARKGGKASSGSFGEANAADPSEAGKRSHEHDPGRDAETGAPATSAASQAASATEPAGVEDAIGLLLAQHEQIKTLFAETADATDPGEREAKFYTLRRLLAVHETAEEEIIHPRARVEIEDGATVVGKRLEEEHEAKTQLAELESLAVDSPEFEKKLAQLREDVLAHAEAEERDEFSRLREELEPRQLQAMRRAVEIAESLAPTRPHAGVESVGANLLAGPFAAMLDRARDAITKPKGA